MPQEFNITADDVAYAEGILLPPGEHFDDERITFITNLTTMDLQAVPGSGKTTALLAKLLILDRYLPFEDGSGILVISHTNAAVDEIRERIGKHCKRLFSYPNFVGTIQSFVDTFLCIPYYSLLHKAAPYRIDDEIYFQNHYVPHQAKGWLRNRGDAEDILFKSRLIGEDTLTYGFSDKTFPLTNKGSDAYVGILKLKLNLRLKGYLCFEDAYLLAFEYLNRYPQMQGLLQKRFSYLFVDEMQDMARHQYEILEQIFFSSGASPTIFQRIGDKNQGIFTDEVQLDEFWQERSPLELNGSHRLSPLIAAAVTPFAIRPITIEAKNTSVTIKPHIFVYTNDTIKNVVPFFTDFIASAIDQGHIVHTEKNKYKAVAWSAKPKEGDIRLPDYFEGFSKEQQNPKTEYPNLESYLYLFDKKDKTLNSIRLNIINAFLRILRIENILDDDGRSFSRYGLNNLMRDDANWYEDFSSFLYESCIQVIRGKTDDVLVSIQKHVPTFLTHFGIEIKNSKTFIEEEYVPTHEDQKKEIGSNFYEHPGTKIKVEVTTVHAVKGQTHTATLYMETHYQIKTDGGSYESERLAQQISQQTSPDLAKIKSYTKQSLKMMYVGFSRPTHLLCFAVHKDRFDACLTGFNPDVWEVISVT